MNIGFDAKRAFLNQSGLGNYSRTLITSLCSSFPGNHYILFTPKKTNPDFLSFASERKNISVIEPEKFLDKRITANWRSYGITGLLGKYKTDVYHGLSNELPFNINKFGGKKIVTIHDLIFLRHPELYPLIDRTIYTRKFRSACELADTIVATSEQTKTDIVEFYAIDPRKIRTVYQSCSEAFYKEHSQAEDKKVLSQYNLPANYLLYVGTIEERKNLLTILKALAIVKDIPLVVVGKKKAYFKKIKKYISANGLDSRIFFYENVLDKDLPAFYRNAGIFIYPSLFEGFGIPIIEALTCGTPVITTKGGCFAEAGGPGSVYIDPLDHEELAAAIDRFLSSDDLRKDTALKGYGHAKQFFPASIAAEMMKIYSEK